MKRIILADDHAIFREALKTVLLAQGYEIAAEAENFTQLETLLAKVAADIVICDCSMPGGSPISSYPLISQQQPECKLVYLTGIESGFLFQQLQALGVSGIVMKKGPITNLLTAIDVIASGDVYFSDGVLDSISNNTELLSAKEFQVLELILQGHSNPKIAELISRTESTVNTHRVNVMAKLGVNSVVQLVNFARDNGLYHA